MTATTGTSEQIAAAIVNRAIHTLEPPQQLETGALVLLRMAAHSRSPNQQEYFAPAVVLAQYEPNGEIDALVWDASAGNAFVHGYAIRDLGTRDTQQGREQYVIQSNIGQVLFSPRDFANLVSQQDVIYESLHVHRETMHRIMNRLDALEAAATAPVSDAVTAPPSEAKAPAVKPVTERK